MLTAFENIIADYINANGLFRPSGGILVAVSGGADSTALMHVLHSLLEKGTFYFFNHEDVKIKKSRMSPFLIAHINHQLRGRAADEDEAFAIETARELGLPVLTRRVAVADFAAKEKLSIETAARKLRMDALVAMAKENGCTYIAFAHHKDDNAETIVHKMLRGTAWRGLAGIWPVKQFPNGITFVRPMLCVTREQIIFYLNESKITWRHDHTNDDQAITRNFIRHSLLPAMQSQSRDSLIELIDHLSTACRGYVDLLDKQVGQLWPRLVLNMEHDRIELDREVFADAPAVFKAEIIRRALVAIGSGERDLTQEHYERILRFAQARRLNKSLSLPNGFIVHFAKTLIFENPSAAAVVWRDLPWKIETQVLDAKACNIETFKTQKTRYVEWFDADKIVGTPMIRLRKTGDSFWPIGLAAPKKIGKFLTDARIDDKLRRSVCVVADDKKIIWLLPLRASEETKITADTKRILQITCSPQKAVKP